MGEPAYRPSPSPVEEYEGDPNQEWVVAGVVGQSIDVLGTRRYEVKWGEGWKRKDGTNTTWEKLDDSSETVQRLIWDWDRKQGRKRAAKAKRSPEIAIGVEGPQLLHEDKTFYALARGYNELVERYPDSPDEELDFDGTLLELNVDSSAGPSVVSARASDPGRSHSPSIPSPSPPPRAVRPIPRRANARRAPSSSPGLSADDEEVARRLRSRFSRREALEREWATKLHDAAPVVFVNEVNGEEVPRLVDGFQYLERHYVRAPNVPSNREYADCLVSCDCAGRCRDAERCGCQDPSELKDEAGRRIFAYTWLRLFTFKLPPGMEVIECNKSCSCSERCPNRVAQRPRDVPIEIFRTRNRGWGARATTPLSRGKVVGIYTGWLTRRADADRLADGRRSYIFDLDVHEGEDEDDEEHLTDKYSVDGYAYGNWTRFVNHSCEPNMRVVPVVWDTIPELNQPYLAFVATADIPARTELTIDYDPKAGEEARAAKQKARRQSPPPGARECMCGAESCRGWVRV
ncbi:SET domain-containing protein [Trametes coccinea BRFM310]|uniref:SET domain-containing protein n=1 Tax=Trametes coccinea (strain BRFM310) TaxID=1353009 RepID=A0A1Y2IXF0_TRAC3|nr:SET domain-containing protein [Trametes coccinea BRFM310]